MDSEEQTELEKVLKTLQSRTESSEETQPSVVTFWRLPRLPNLYPTTKSDHSFSSIDGDFAPVSGRLHSDGESAWDAYQHGW
jgi:hypothetical protein